MLLICLYDMLIVSSFSTVVGSIILPLSWLIFLLSFFVRWVIFLVFFFLLGGGGGGGVVGFGKEKGQDFS